MPNRWTRFVDVFPALIAVACFATATAVGAADAAPRQPSKIAASVQRIMDRMQPTTALGKSAVAPDYSTLSNGIVKVRPSGEVELVLHAKGSITDAEVTAVRALGAEVVTVLKSPGMVQAWIPRDKIVEAAALPWVAAVTPPAYGESNTHPLNPIDSEGVTLHNADIAHSQGITGAGVSIGVISNGVDNLAASQARNELPAVNVINAGSGDEGTAMLEIVHDMAPGATLAFHGTGGGTAGHVTAVQNLVAAGVNVIAEDLAFDSEPAFQQGVVANAREAAAIGGVSVHSSSGNRGANHTARVPAVSTGGGPDGQAGPFNNCTVQPTNVVAIAPGGDTTFDMTLGMNTRFTLQWSEPRAIFPTAGQGGFTNLDLMIMDAALTQCLYESVGVQASGVGDTIEQIATNNGTNGTAVKVVVNVTGTSTAVAAPLLDLRWRGSGGQTDTATRAGSNDPDKNYTGRAFSIGAVFGGSGALEGFSSAGPVDLVSTTTCMGGGAGPCNGVAGAAAQQFQGLDFLGADGVSVSGVGAFGAGTCPAPNPGGQGQCQFFGTSAAAPHTAGCDALVRDLIGAAAAPATVRSKLAATALDLGPPGEDPTNGAGIVDCFLALDPPKAMCQSRTVPTDPNACSAASVSIDSGSFDPGGGAITLAQTPPGPYALGATLVTLKVTDSDSLFTSCQATVTVQDKQAPTIQTVSATPSTLWPPNHKMVPVAVMANVSDNCGGTTTCQIISVTSNEPVDGLGDGDTAPDWEITGDLTLNLRSERAGPKNGRVYTVTVRCTDASGNSSQKSVPVTVAHDQG